MTLEKGDEIGQNGITTDHKWRKVEKHSYV